MGNPHVIIRRDDEIHFHEPQKVRRDQFNGLGPAPETKTGVIACYKCSVTDGKSYDEKIAFTMHEYAGRKTVSSNKDVPLYHEMHYKCCKCGADRVWGTEIIGN
jgi:DNA-directed RNA polymerase subunit RPC12/RpoP